MKHTPGPWSAPSAGIYAGPMVDGYATGPLIASVGTREVLKQMRKFKRNTLQEVDANARLIAAAPDLLAALEAVLPYAIDIFTIREGEINIYAQARAAIAKAK